jgi:hypothetical protein
VEVACPSKLRDEVTCVCAVDEDNVVITDTACRLRVFHVPSSTFTVKKKTEHPVRAACTSGAKRVVTVGDFAEINVCTLEPSSESESGVRVRMRIVTAYIGHPHVRHRINLIHACRLNDGTITCATRSTLFSLTADDPQNTVTVRWKIKGPAVSAMNEIRGLCAAHDSSVLTVSLRRIHIICVNDAPRVVDSLQWGSINSVVPTDGPFFARCSCHQTETGTSAWLTLLSM